MCDSRKRECFCEGSKKARSARKISRCARNGGRGEWVYFMQRTTDMFGKRYSCIVIPSEAEGSFWHTGIAPYVRQRKTRMLLRRKQERAECKEDFSTTLKMTVWGDGFISCSVQRICLESAIPVSSSRPKWRDLSCRRG